MQMNKFIVVAALTLCALNGQAHDFWIEPDTFTPAPGDDVQIELREGEYLKGNTLPYIEQWFRDFSMVTAEGRTDIISLTGNDPAANIAAAEGQMLLGYQSIRNFVELDAAKFNKYLEAEGIQFLREERIKRGEDEAPAPEYFVRCAKSLLQASPTDNPVYAERLGYTLELVPEADPYKQAVGDELSFILYFRGKPVEGLQLTAFTQEDPEATQKIRTDADGRARITLDRPGDWMVKAVNIQGIIADPKALWQSWWATYLFSVD